MTSKDIIIALTIYFVVPSAGLLSFLRLKRRMKTENIPNAPVPELFMVFLTYGGLLLVVLTQLLWEWSGMASLGTFYLILGAPAVMGVIAFRHRRTKTVSKYHRWTYLSGLFYFALAPATFIILFYCSG
jgi:uncharacterized membrane protein SirB2